MTMKRLLSWLTSWLLCVAGLLAALPAAALQIVDDRGVTVTLPRSPQRIVSLLPSLTESVCALGQCHRLVGVDRYSTWPERVRKLPQVGGGIDPSIEAIVALRPDLVLVGDSRRATPRLQALGLPVVSLQPKTHADVRRTLDQLGRILEVPDAQRIWRAIDEGMNQAARSLPEQARGMRVYFEVNSGPYGAGESSFIGETLSRLGVGNILPAALGPFPRLNPEYIVRADPDLIMIGARNAPGLQQRPGWDRLRAMHEQRLCIFQPDEADVLVRPGPRMAEAAQIMARCLARHAGPGPNAEARR